MSKATTSTFKGPEAPQHLATGGMCLVTMLGPEELAEFNLEGATAVSATIIPSPGAIGDVVFKGRSCMNLGAPGFPTLPHCEHIESEPIHRLIFMGLCAPGPLTIAKVMKSGDVAVLLGNMIPGAGEVGTILCESSEGHTSTTAPHPIIPFPKFDCFVDWDSIQRSIKKL